MKIDSSASIDFDQLYQPIVFPYQVAKNNFEETIWSKTENYKPCTINSNLIFDRKTSLEELMKKTAKSLSYFFHIRHCDKGVKQSRLIDGRPTFYPGHLPPAYSSWIMVSKNYTSQRMLPLILEGLIFLRQLKGTWSLKLSIRQDCNHVCPNELPVILNEGEGLLFLTDLWDLSYSPHSANEPQSISFLTETDWR